MNARLYDPALGRFLSPDPVVQQPDGTQAFNRYTYCLNNPLRYVDLDGLAWLMAKYAGEYFIFFDDRVKNASYLPEFFRNHANITILDDDAVIYTKNLESDEIINEFHLYPDGNFMIDGISQTSEYNNNGILHIGSTNFTSPSTIANNWYGSYLGPYNPTLNRRDYSYSIPPIDWHDYYAFQHDQGYDRWGASGSYDALFNTNTINTDFQFAIRMLSNPETSNTYLGKMAGNAFMLIYGLKLNLIFIQSQPWD